MVYLIKDSEIEYFTDNFIQESKNHFPILNWKILPLESFQTQPLALFGLQIYNTHTIKNQDLADKARNRYFEINFCSINFLKKSGSFLQMAANTFVHLYNKLIKISLNLPFRLL